MDIGIVKLLSGTIFLCALSVSQANGKKNVEISSFMSLSKYDTSWIDWQTLRVTKKGPNQFVVSGDLKVARNIGDEQFVDIRVLRQQDTSKSYAPPLYRINKPVCQYVSTDEFFYPSILKHSNLPAADVCPVPKGEYQINNLIFDGDVIPAAIPAGEYKVIITIFDGQKDVAAVEADLELTAA